MTPEQEKMLRDWSGLDWRDAARCKPQPLQAAVAALLARCEEAESEADKNWAAFTSAFESYQVASDERDAALAKLGVVMEALRPLADAYDSAVIWQGKNDEEVYFYSVQTNVPGEVGAKISHADGRRAKAALASEPEIVAVVGVIAVADHEVVVGRPEGYEFGPNDRAIIVRRAE